MECGEIMKSGRKIRYKKIYTPTKPALHMMLDERVKARDTARDRQISRKNNLDTFIKKNLLPELKDKASSHVPIRKQRIQRLINLSMETLKAERALHLKNQQLLMVKKDLYEESTKPVFWRNLVSTYKKNDELIKAKEKAIKSLTSMKEKFRKKPSKRYTDSLHAIMEIIHTTTPERTLGLRISGGKTRK